MKCDDQILYYIENNYKTFDEKINFLIVNGLPFHLYPDAENESLKKSILSNRIYELATQKEITKINKLFSQNNISAIFFKGVILSHQLYPKTFMRKVGDIDLFVLEGSFETAANILLTLGYAFAKPEKMLAEHHVVFNNDIFFVELHKSIYHPMIGIDEDFLKLSIDSIEINRERFFTFNVTATLLHLLYHLYMDTYLTVGNLYNVFATKSLLKAGRFIYRAYEIALFSEKYFKQIKWDEIINDLKKQKLRVFFETMINDIIEIFPNTFPKSFIDAVNNMEYVIYEKDDLYKYIMDSNSLNKNIDAILSGYIDYQWNNRVYKNLQIDSVGGFTLDNPIIKDQEINNNYLLTCNVQVKKSENGIKLFFKVTNDDFCFSKEKDYDTQTSDGVHLIICGTEKYSYNSIFLFPKIVDDEIVVIPVNVLNSENSEISDLLISTSYQKFETEYIITAVLKNEFLKRNNIEKHFYLGLVISDCSSKTKRRKGELILSNPYNEWYNPVYFAKVSI